MKRIVAIFTSEESVRKAVNELSTKGMSSNRVVKLGTDYESQVRQELFYSYRDTYITFTWALVGLIAGAALFYWLAGNNSLGILTGRLLAGGLPVTVFTGAGTGMAVAAMLSGVYRLSKPLALDHNGHWLLILYCSELRQRAEAREIILRQEGMFP